MVDLGCKHAYEPSDPHAVDIDIHYVLRRGKPGLYVYAILSHPASYPATGIGEWRIVWPTNEKNGNYVLDKIYVDEKRHWTMPTLADQAAAQTMGIKEISLFKTGAWAGRMESKYTYSATYEDIGASASPATRASSAPGPSSATTSTTTTAPANRTLPRCKAP